MASSPSELTLDYKPNGGGRVCPMMAKQAAVLGDHAGAAGSEQLPAQKVRELLGRLEEERLKIDAFKRELPLCMQLLNQAMEAYRQQLEACQGAPRPVLEEFMPLKNIGIDGTEKPANAPSEKASWMVSAQLWNHPADAAAKAPQLAEHPLVASPGLALDAKQRNGGAFLPFAKETNGRAGCGSPAAASHALPELALAPTEKDPAADIGKKHHEIDSNGDGDVGVRREQNGVMRPAVSEAQPAPPQTHRKARRCWSPDLHRRFVNALQILGGAQVATPKQIRELMKVEGLTNDEVKSHLQKYRLHTRRPMQPPATPSSAAPQLVVLGGIWVPPEYAASAGAPAIYGAHPAQPHYAAAAAAQEYYSSPAAVAAAAAAHHHLQHQAMHRAVAPAAYKARVGSPASERRSGGERSESIDEEGDGEDREEEDDDEAAATKAGEELSGGGMKY